VLSYDWSTGRAGTFNVGVSGSYYVKFGSTAVVGAPEVDLAGTILNPPKYQMRPYLGWRWDGLNARATLNVIDSYTNNLVTPAQKVSSQATLDLHIDYDVGKLLPGRLKTMRLALDITNLFDQAPPFANVGPSAYSEGGYDASLYSPVGRIVAVGLTADF
jgi:iron complex outermembrane receptor protein